MSNPRTPRRWADATITCLILTALMLSGPKLVWANERIDFIAAEQAWKKGQHQDYQRLKGRLIHYPLYEYLEYWELSANLGTASSKVVSRFLERYPDGANAARLRRDWLKRLATEKRWSEYLKFYDDTDDNITRRCHQAHALVAASRGREAFSEAPELWLHGHSRPDACNPVFDAWRRAGGLTTDLVWQRISLAMDAGSVQLAKYLGRYLPARDKPWLNLWLDIHENPEKLLTSVAKRPDHPVKDAVLAHAIKRMARSNPHSAARSWADYRRRYAFDADAACSVDRRLAIKLEDETDATAYRFFKDKSLCLENKRVREGRLRAALTRQDWSALSSWINELPDDERSEDRWRYWKARALEGSGRKKKARELYAEIARERTYYGFLAADRIGTNYRDDHQTVPSSKAERSRISRLPAMERMRELYRLGRETDARREWWYFSKIADEKTLLAAAAIFHDWGWTDRAIFSAAKAEYWDDLEIRFPLKHKNLVQQYATQRALDPAWVYGVLRQESAFMSSVRSSAGAVGLMQLLPATARKVAKEYGLKRPSSSALRDPETNIQLGTGYLRMMLDKFGNQPVLATAAYNAGPHRVIRWIPSRSVPTDSWVEAIPFPETRTYVQRVMAYSVIYEQRLKRKPKRMTDRMGKAR